MRNTGVRQVVDKLFAPVSLSLANRTIALNLFFLLFVSSLLLSCSNKVPKDILPQKKMTDVLVDVHVADALLAHRPIDSARKEINSYYNGIFEHHGIDSVQLRSSLEYYAEHPVLMKAIYTQIEERLNAFNAQEQQEIDEKYRLQRAADSILNARRIDSLYKEEMKRIDFQRKRHLLLSYEADSTVDRPVAVTYEELRTRLYEEIRLPSVYTYVLQQYDEQAKQPKVAVDSLGTDISHALSSDSLSIGLRGDTTKVIAPGTGREIR